MFVGLRAACSCGTSFALPREAFASGMPCPGCGTDYAPGDLMTFRPPGPSRSMCLQVLWVLAALVLAKGFLLVWLFVSHQGPGLQSILRDLQLSPRPVMKLFFSENLLPILEIGVVLAAGGTLAWGLWRARGGRRPGLRAPLVLCALLSVLVLVGALFSMTTRVMLTEL